MKALLCLAAVSVLIACSPAARGAQKVSFASGTAIVPLPEAFRVETSGNDLSAVFGADKDHRLELTLLEIISSADRATDLAVQFVKQQGAKKGIEVKLSDGRAVMMESGAQEKRGDTTFQSVHWLIAKGNCVFTMTLSAPLPMSRELDAFLGDPLNAIANEIECKES